MKKWSIFLIVAFVVILPIVWYLASPLFLDKTVNEEIPVSQSEEVIAEGGFVNADSFHMVSGQAKIVSADGKDYLRLENFEATNGPDLKVYFANDLEANDYVSLGALKGNIGNQNYEIPANINYSDYGYILIWCERFGVLFGSAEVKKSSF